MSGLALATAGFAQQAHAPSDIALGGDDVPVRPYADGSGPSAIFRLGRIDSRHEDIFGVIDPLRWRIQYYTLADWQRGGTELSFSQRWKAVGSCRLSPRFRVWRVHSFPGRIVLQSQPIVPRQAFVYDPGKKASVRFQKLTLAADPGELQRIADTATTASDQIPASDCVPSSDVDSMPSFSAQDASTVVRRDSNIKLTVSRQPSAALTSFDEAPVDLSYRQRWISSAQELEEGATVSSGKAIRHFLVTTRTDVPGFVSTQTLLFRRGEAGRFNGVMAINLGLNRVKLGQRPVAVSSRGEVLVLGAPDHSGFRVHRCTFLDQPGAMSQCSVEDADGDPGAPPPATGDDLDRKDEAGLPMWKTAFDYTDREFIIDTSALPEPCRALMVPCSVGGITWSPLPEFRSNQDRFVHRKGFPYGQVTGVPFSAILHATAGDPALAPHEGQPFQVDAIEGGKPVVFGDIFNEGPIREPQHARVFGIDCSSFLATLWDLKAKLDTKDFIDEANAHRSHISRVEGMSSARIGDAFVINISEDSEHKYINHIVLFREEMAAGPADASQAVLVVEANGSCGGACWSFYDESFLNGWGILRHADAKPDPLIKEDIPKEGVKWRTLFAR